MLQHAVSRRTMLVASATGLAVLPGVGLSRAVAGKSPASGSIKAGTAKSTILFFQCGGASHLAPVQPAGCRAALYSLF